MVNRLQRKKSVVAKLSEQACSESATAKGGLAALEAFARCTGLWLSCDRHLPARRDPGQGFTTTTAAVGALVHGPLSRGPSRITLQARIVGPAVLASFASGVLLGPRRRHGLPLFDPRRPIMMSLR
jgi:hypothetical protein